MTKYSDMTRKEAAKLRTEGGKNYNGGKYDNPYIPDNAYAGAFKMAFIIFVLAVIIF